MSFYYFLPGETGQVTESMLDEYGLSYIIDPTDQIVQRKILQAKHIDNMPGAICGNGRYFQPMEMKYSDDIKWSRGPKKGDKQPWIGYKGELPLPHKLKRTVSLPGNDFVDDIGRHWRIPIAYRFAEDGGEIMLPSCSQWDDELGIMLPNQVTRIYRPLWDLVWKGMKFMYQSMEEDGSVSFEMEDEQKMVLLAFQANYHLGFQELSLLEVWTSSLVSSVWSLIIDYEGLQMLKKKEDQTTGSTDTGDTVTTEV